MVRTSGDIACRSSVRWLGWMCAVGFVACRAPESEGVEESDVPADRLPEGGVECEGRTDGLSWTSSAQADGLAGVADVAALGTRVWTCSDRGGLVEWDVSREVPQPRPLDEDRCVAVAVRAGDGAGDERVAVAFEDRVDVYGVGEDAPRTSWPTDQDVAGLDDVAGVLWVSARSGGVRGLIESSGGTGASTVRHTLEIEPADARAVAIDDGHLLVANGRYGLVRFDLQGDEYELVGARPVPGTAVDVVARDGHGYFATLEGIATYDMADHALVYRAVTPGAALQVEAFGGMLAVADWTSVQLLSIAEPSRPAPFQHEVLVSSGPLTRARAIAVEAGSGRVYVGRWDGLDAYAPLCPVSAPSIRVEAERLDFREVEPGSSRSLVLVVRNTGAEPLELTGVEAEPRDVSVDVVSRVLEPGEALSIESTFAPGSSDPVEGMLTLYSNDPDDPQWRVPWTANVPGRGLGDRVAPFLDVDSTGAVWDSSALDARVVLLAYFADW